MAFDISTENKKNKAKHKDNAKLIDLSLFDRPLASGNVSDHFTIYNYLTFKNIVIIIIVATFLIFLGSAVSLQMAILSAALLGILTVLLLEISSRRKWEHSLLQQFQKMNTDYERVVRDIARNRNDTASIRTKISHAAGTFARSYPPEGKDIEREIISTLLDQLSELGDISDLDCGVVEPPANIDLSLFEEDPNLEGTDAVQLSKHLTDEQILQLVHAAIKQDRIDLFLQPIVTLPQRKLRFYETFARIRIKEEIYLPAARYMKLAMEEDLIPIIDNLLLLRGLQAIRDMAERDYNYAFFFNITSATLNDTKFMGDLVEFISKNRDLSPQLVFELHQEDLKTMNRDVFPIFDGLAELGCRFSMDRVKGVNFDYRDLESHHIRFIKINRAIIFDELKEAGGLLRLQRLKSELDRSGVDLIVEHIETDRKLVDILDVDIDYGQGYLFGEPKRYKKA